jgi:hypothetical protein
MARIQLSGTQIPTLSKLNIDGEITLDAQSGTSGQVLISQGSLNTPAWTSSPTFSTLTADQVFATNNGSGTNFKVGDDAWIGDINVANTVSVRGQQSAANGYISFGNADNTALGRASTGPLTYGGEKVSYSSVVFSLADSVGAASSTLRNIFASTNDVLSGIAPATLYAFRAKYFFNFTYAGGSMVPIFHFTFSNAPTAIKWSFKTYSQAGGTFFAGVGASSTTNSSAILASNASASGSWVTEIDGYFTSHASSSSTLTPQINTPAPISGPGFIVNAGSWFEVEKLGTSTQTLIAGNWA